MDYQHKLQIELRYGLIWSEVSNSWKRIFNCWS